MKRERRISASPIEEELGREGTTMWGTNATGADVVRRRQGATTELAKDTG